MKFFVVLAIFLFLIPLLYADGIVNGKDDIEFAMSLARWGYDDLSEELLGKITQERPEVRKQGEKLRCDLKVERASRIVDPEEKQKKYEEVISCYNRLLDSFNGTKRWEMFLNLGDVYISRSQELIELNKETKKEKEAFSFAREYLREALKLFDEAKKRNDGAGSDLEARSEDPSEKERAERANIRYHAWYGICRVYYFLGICDDKANLDRCKSELENYIWEYEGRIGGYYAMLLSGLVFHELTNYKKAVVYYDGVFKPLKSENHPVAIDLCLQACYYKAKTFVAWKKFPQVVALVDEYQKHYRTVFKEDFSEQGFGQASLLEMGKAYIGQGNTAKAIEIAQSIAEKQTYWSNVAKRLMLEWGKYNPEALNDAKNAYLVATGLWRESKYQKAILAFMRVIEYSKSDEDIEKYAIDSWERIGQGFWHLKLYQESALAYEQCATKYRKYKKIVEVAGKTQKISVVSKAAYWAYRGYNESHKLSQDPEDKKRADEMRNLLVTKFKNSPYAFNLSFATAAELEREADQQKDLIAGAKKYIQAAKAYQRVHKKADLFERALAGVGKCYYKAARQILQKADLWKKTPGTFKLPDKVSKYLKVGVKYIQRYHSYTKKFKLNELEVQKISRRKESMAESLFYLGNLYLRLNEVKKAEQALNELRSDYPEQGEMFAGATFLLVRTKVDNNRLAEAEEMIQEMERVSGEDAGGSMAKYQSFSYYLVGKKYEDQANEQEKVLNAYSEIDKEKPEYQKLLAEYFVVYKKAADYLEKWIDRKDSPSLAVLEAIGSKFAVLGGVQKNLNKQDQAKDYYRKALKLFRKCLEKHPKKDSEEYADLQEKTAKCAIETGDWEQSIAVFYPIYRTDKEERKKQREKEKGPRGTKEAVTQSESYEYLNYLTEILCGLGQQNSYGNPEKLYNFLLKYAQQDIVDEFEDDFFSRSNTTPKLMFERYIVLQRNLAWIQGQIFEDENIKKLEKEFQKEEAERAGLTDEQLRLKGLKKLQFVYRQRFLDDVEDFVKKTDLPSTVLQERIRRLSLYLAYEHTYRLSERISRYKNPKLAFGAYDNPQWWEAKYRQFLVLGLKGGGYAKEAIKSIDALKEQQDNMGGPEYKEKFNNLLLRIK